MFVCFWYYRYFDLFTASEVASNKKNNAPNSVPYKVRSFAKKMDDGSKSDVSNLPIERQNFYSTSVLVKIFIIFACIEFDIPAFI